jgi:hypothetical protein
MTETIAAFGVALQHDIPSPGRWAFTKALIEVLEESIEESFSAAMLHSRILGSVKCGIRGRLGEKGTGVEPQATPIYILTSGDCRKPSINLSRICPPDERRYSEQADGQQSIRSPAQDPTSKAHNNNLMTLLDRDLAVPHVLISVALEGDQLLDAQSFIDWLKGFPALGKYAHIRGVYQSSG